MYKGQWLPLSASWDLFLFPFPPHASEGEGQSIGGRHLLDADGHVGPGHGEHRALIPALNTWSGHIMVITNRHHHRVHQGVPELGRVHVHHTVHEGVPAAHGAGGEVCRDCCGSPCGSCSCCCWIHLAVKPQINFLSTSCNFEIFFNLLQSLPILCKLKLKWS